MININPKHASQEIRILVKKVVMFQENNSCSKTNISKASMEIYLVTAEAIKTSPIKIRIIVRKIFLKLIKTNYCSSQMIGVAPVSAFFISRATSEQLPAQS